MTAAIATDAVIERDIGVIALRDGYPAAFDRRAPLFRLTTTVERALRLGHALRSFGHAREDLALVQDLLVIGLTVVPSKIRKARAITVDLRR